jgi:hypothetical protein
MQHDFHDGKARIKTGHPESKFLCGRGSGMSRAETLKLVLDTDGCKSKLSVQLSLSNVSVTQRLLLSIKANLENATNLIPVDGFQYYFQVSVTHSQLCIHFIS